MGYEQKNRKGDYPALDFLARFGYEVDPDRPAQSKDDGSLLSGESR